MYDRMLDENEEDSLTEEGIDEEDNFREITPQEPLV